MFKAIVVNWITSLLGGVAGIPQIIEGVTNKNGWLIVSGVATFALGLASKQANVTGGTVTQ